MCPTYVCLDLKAAFGTLCHNYMPMSLFECVLLEKRVDLIMSVYGQVNVIVKGTTRRSVVSVPHYVCARRTLWCIDISSNTAAWRSPQKPWLYKYWKLSKYTRAATGVARPIQQSADMTIKVAHKIEQI